MGFVMPTLLKPIVVTTDGENVNSVIIKFVDHTVFLTKPPRPEAREIMF